MSIALFKAWVYGQKDYIARLIEVCTDVETYLNQIFAQLTGQSGALAVPLGLQEIFDRQGLIGIGSYDFTEATLSGPAYNFSVAAGAYYNAGIFYHKAGASTLSMAGRDTGVYYLGLDAAGNPLVQTSPDATTTRQFSWNSSTHAITAKAIYAGVAILLDGDEYADMLTSAARAKTFTKVADRLEEIEGLLGEMSGFYAEDPANHAGLDFYFFGGKVRNDSVISVTAAGYVTLADDATNYVEADPADGAVSANAVGFTSGLIALFQVVTASGAITGVTDVRTWALAGTGGGGGGHTQNTDLGTTAGVFEIDRDASGSPAGKAGIEVNNGDDPKASIKFDRNSQRWVYSIDGELTWHALGEVDLSLAAQQFSKFVPLDDPPEVFAENARGSSVDYEPVDLTSHLGSPQFGVGAAVLRVFFSDSAPGIGVKVLLKKGGGVSSPAVAFTVWSDENGGEQKPADILIPIGDDYTIEFYVFASGANTANLRIFLLGYFEVVYGVGTQEKTITQNGIAVAADTTEDITFDAFVNRGLCHYLKIEETGALVTNVYDLHLYADAAFTTLLYKVENIIPGTPYEDYLPFWVYDVLNGRQLRVRIINHDVSQQGTYSLNIIAEQFA